VELPRPTIARLLELSRYAGSASLPFPLVILVLVKKARDLLLQLRRLARLAHGNGVFEKLPRWMGVGRSFHCKRTAAPRHCKIRPSCSERGTGMSRLGSSDAGPGAPPSLSHLARALASESLGFGRFGVLAIMHARWDPEESAATGNEAKCRARQSDLASQHAKDAKLL
jgi:hypothetical protein